MSGRHQGGMGLCVVLLCGSALLPGALRGAEGSAADEKDIAQRVSLAESLKDSVARIEFTLRFDKGEAPRTGLGSMEWGYGENFVDEERPLEHPAFILSPTRVVTIDEQTPSRFIEAIAVRFGSQIVEARPVAYALDREIAFFDLSEPLEGVRPLKFDAAAKGPLLSVEYQLDEGRWTLSVGRLSGSVQLAVEGPPRCVLESSDGGFAVVVTEDATPVGLLSGKMPADGSWKGSPEDWPRVPAEKLEALENELSRTVDAALLRVHISFRSPQSGQESPYGRYSFGRDEESATELHVPGILVDDRTVLVVAGLTAKVTARLERIRVFAAEGTGVEASFLASLADYNAFVVRLNSPLSPAASFHEGDIAELPRRLLLGARLSIRGEQRIVYLSHVRIPTVDLGRYRRLYPETMGDASDVFVFDREGRLVCFPMDFRPKASLERSYQGQYGESTLLPAQYLAPLLADLPAHADPHNVPLTEEEENRLAWLGVELQSLNPELARMNGVADQTQDGETGALVTYVYPDSPAAAAGLELGDILLRVAPEGYPRAVEVQCRDDYGFDGGAFPWDRLDEIPEQYFDEIPRPWPSAGSPVNRLLTDIGFGKPFTLELSRDGSLKRLPMVSTKGPPYFDSAPKFKSETLGLTVRELTYEVRRYFQRAPEEPGLIIAKIEQGSKASVSGLKPYEIITHINDQPVTTVAEFEKAVLRGGELRFSIKRMNLGRIVKVQIATEEE